MSVAFGDVEGEPLPIIFGIKRKAYRLATVFAVCTVCHTPAAQAVSRLRTFFSLFFVPVVPLTSTYRTTCTMCGGSVKVTKEAALALVAGAQQQAASASGGAPVAPLPTPGPAAAPSSSEPSAELHQPPS